MLENPLLASWVLCLAPVALAQGPDAEALVAQGWELIPAYSGEHRSSLSPDMARRVAAASHLFAAASELQPDHVRAYWSLGHAEVLLAEDARSRRDRGESGEHVERAELALARGIELDPGDPWVFYARGALRVGFGDPVAGLGDLDQALVNIEARRANGGPPENWLRFKALEWRPEALMRNGRFDEARAALDEFHGEFSTNAFPLHMARAESWLRQRELVRAGEEFGAVLEAFPNDPQAYATSAYIAGLLGDRGKATELLQSALQREIVPGLYTRLWLWILATDEALPAAEEDLRGFLANPPSDLSEWDRDLGRFCLGEGSPEGFFARVREETARRLDAGVALDALMTEVSFYVGLRYERDAVAELTEGERARHLSLALNSHRSALVDRPVAWKWEWAFARLHYARLAGILGGVVEPTYELVDGHLHDGPFRDVPFEAMGWHRPRSEAPVSDLEDVQAGDLLMGRLGSRYRVWVRGIR